MGNSEMMAATPLEALCSSNQHATRCPFRAQQLLLTVLTLTLLCSGSASAVAQDAAADSKAATQEKSSGTDKKPSDEASSGDASKEDEKLYVRIRKNSRNLAQALETSIVTLENSKKYPGTRVDLIGAIHLGEPEYYKALNEKFKEYDVVLFEAVMPEEAVRQDYRPGAPGAGRGELSDEEEWTEAKIGLTAISVLQLGMKDALGFEFQLGGVDYSPKNFVHADMTAEEFEASMAKRGESFSEMLAREMSKSMLEQQKQNPLAMNLDMMISALASDRLYRVRRIAAAQLEKADEGDAFAGYDGSSTIITERNIKALEILRKQLTSSAKPKKLAVFYGAGHLADMEKRMTHVFGYERTGESWLTAWHLRPPEATKP